MTATFILTVAALLVEGVEKRSGLTAEKRSGAPEEYSGLWSRTIFAWLATTFRAGYSKVIVPQDLPILATQLRSSALHRSLVSTWAKYNPHTRYSLLKACFHENMLSFLSGIPPRLCKSVFYLTHPLLIHMTVSYVGDPSANVTFGRALIGVWALVFLGIAFSTAIFSYQTTRFVARLKGGLIGLIYEKRLSTRAVDLGETTAVALMGTDVERIGQNLQSIHDVWASVIEIGVAIWLLERQVILACLAPVAVISVSVCITVPMSNSVKKAQVAWIERVQERLRVTSAMLDGMKAVKMLGLSSVVSGIIERARLLEIRTSKTYRKLFLWNVLL
ncbi:hypothetical protein F4780DRAFT_33728 [Xylariomycetidae sp. FL0641]|nr:hypothetical protein F4780DRAFT_33728 [Xylariomycetidae sp. FL0641]